MTLTNIEYGSIASSSVINGNFSYLDERITTSNSQINSSISSLLSNVATINTRLNEISDNVSASVAALQNTLADYKSKTKLLVKNSSMVPDWAYYRSISLASGNTYTPDTNGYVLIFPESAASGKISIGEVSINCKARVSAYDNASQLVAFPVKAGDVISATVSCTAAYYIPVEDVTVENF